MSQVNKDEHTSELEQKINHLWEYIEKEDQWYEERINKLRQELDEAVSALNRSNKDVMVFVQENAILTQRVKALEGRL